MSNGIASLPSGGGVTVIAEHRSRRDPDQHHPTEDETPADHHSGEQHQQGDRPPRPTSSPGPVLDEQGLPAETLFETTLLATRLLPTTVSRSEFLLRQNQEWTPPESGLRLTDKLI